MNWLKSLLLAALIIVMVVAGKYWFLKEDAFPYGESSADVLIQLKAPAISQHSVYTIAAGEIEGEADLTSAPTLATGQSLVNSQIVGVTSTFENSTAPYPGQITAEIVCNTRKYVKAVPINFAGAESKLILAVANARRAFGSCAVEQIKYATGVWSAYDEQKKQVVTVRLFKALSQAGQIENAQQEILGLFRKVINHEGGM